MSMRRSTTTTTNSAEVNRGQVIHQGIRSPYLESGNRHSDEAVVFVHGNPGSSEDWRDLVGRVGSFARSVAPDMPGFGQADKPKDFDYTVEGYARHLEGILNHLGVQRAHLVLHDFGGAWGLAWAAQHPERLLSVTLINIGLMPGYRWHYLARIWRTPLLGELFFATTTRTAFGLSLRHGNPRGLPKAMVDRMYRDLDRGTKRAVLRLYRATNNPGQMAEMLGPLFRQLDVPALVIWGAADPYVPVRFAERQRAFFPRARIVILEQSGHWPFADDPESVAGALIPFLQKQPEA
ncbi:alpha/beta hydrolase [Rhodocaloribacter litoris]|uniref:alpha/beta fold hydrolase n=1 Tax=Rhodocaloribacter litoris TaxID=2558931 RepID=UPI001E54B858|nr:alpha/beta hydrolase [Rhodocaloribacter litoris]QXD15652.1 alpha/beta hydrolase [Rhodocaloribacter litoris]